MVAITVRVRIANKIKKDNQATVPTDLNGTSCDSSVIEKKKNGKGIKYG